MNNKIKKFFTLILITSIGYLFMKFYQIFKGLIELDKTLPQYLGNIIGEKPEVSIQASLNRITVIVKYSKDIIKKNDGLDNIVTDYVTDFYPIFKAAHLKVIIKEASEKTEEEFSPDEKE